MRSSSILLAVTNVMSYEGGLSKAYTVTVGDMLVNLSLSYLAVPNTERPFRTSTIASDKADAKL